MPTPSDPVNQRNLPRLPAPDTLRLGCRRGGSDGGELANGLLDLSEGGLQFLSRAPLTMGESLEVVLYGTVVPEPVRRCGEVRWLVELGGGACCAGLRFVEPVPSAVLGALLDGPAAIETERFLFDPVDTE